MALPPWTTPRLPNVPLPVGDLAVSPWMHDDVVDVDAEVVARRSGPGWWRCPGRAARCRCTPGSLPLGSTRTVACSHGPKPQISTYDAEADAHQLALGSGLLLLLAEALVAGDLQRLVERLLVLAGVVAGAERGGVRELVGRR